MNHLVKFLFSILFHYNNVYQLNEIYHHNLKDQFLLKFDNGSSYNFVEHLILIGDARISSEGEVWIIASKNKNYTGRMAESDPDYNLKTNLHDKILNEIPKFDTLLSYIVNHHLLDVIIEFALYDIPLGIKSPLSFLKFEHNTKTRSIVP